MRNVGASSPCGFHETSGTIGNYDASTNLTIDGTTGGANGLLSVDLGGLSTKTVAPDVQAILRVDVPNVPDPMAIVPERRLPPLRL